jgi:hypothetical protein
MKSLIMKLAVICAVFLFAFTPTAFSAGPGGDTGAGTAEAGGGDYTWKEERVVCFVFGIGYTMVEQCEKANGRCKDQSCICGLSIF